MKFPFILRSCFRPAACNEPFVDLMSGRCLVHSHRVNLICWKKFHFVLSLMPNSQMLDRESKREKILEGKLREIKIKLKKEQEQAAAQLAARAASQAERAAAELNPPEETPVIKPTLSQCKRFYKLRASTFLFSF